MKVPFSAYREDEVGWEDISVARQGAACVELIGLRWVGLG